MIPLNICACKFHRTFRLIWAYSPHTVRKQLIPDWSFPPELQVEMTSEWRSWRMGKWKKEQGARKNEKGAKKKRKNEQWGKNWKEQGARGENVKGAGSKDPPNRGSHVWLLKWWRWIRMTFQVHCTNGDSTLVRWWLPINDHWIILIGLFWATGQPTKFKSRRCYVHCLHSIISLLETIILSIIFSLFFDTGWYNTWPQAGTEYFWHREQMTATQVTHMLK